MTNDNLAMPRRDFIKVIAAAGLGSLLPAGAAGAPEGASSARVPTRPFGKTGVNVPILSLGGMFDIPSNQLMLRQCTKWGVTYWDTAASYEGGRSEPGFGKFFGDNPAARKDIFLVTKSGKRDAAGLTGHLERSLERMKTDYIDLYFVHAISGIDEMTDEQAAWARRMKKEGRIRFFGFSTHKNMEDCLLGAAKLGWIDGVMFTYNYRIMHQDRMKRAVDACERAGIGMTAMKTQGGGPVKTDSASEIELAGSFVEKGFSPEQAKLKAVWSNPQIAAICSQMPTMRVLTANAAAAMDRAQLSAADLHRLDQYADATCAGYCAGCESICSAASGGAPIGDIMRCLMYHHHYGDATLARAEFARVASPLAARWDGLDLAAAEAACPNHLPIGALVEEARRVLA